MVSIRFYSLVFVFILLHACHSTAHTHQGMESTTAAKRELEATGSVLIKVNKENLDEVLVRNDVERANFGGRKMKLERVLKHEMLKEEALKVEDSKISGAAHFLGNCDPKGSGTPNGQCKLTKRSTHPTKRKMIGFTAYSADYYLPKSHPPKNN